MADFPKPTKEQHGLLNEYSCGCQVRRDGSGVHFIHMCPLHAAAPELLEAMRPLVPTDDVAGMSGSDLLTRHVKVREVKAAREAIRKAEGE